MRAIIIGAGRGRRLMPTTEDSPKCFAEVGGRRILDWTLETFARTGITDVHFVGGYQIDKVQRDYPHFIFHHNADWERNNILASLFCAESAMDQPFVCCYSDILFTAETLAALLSSRADIALMVDTHWRRRYALRSRHPTDDAEKVLVQNGRVTRVHRDIPEGEAHGEYTGVARFSVRGAEELRRSYHDRRARFAGRPFREAGLFEKAYLIQLFQEMVEAGVHIAHVDVPGGYMEVDTQEDFELAQRFWRG
ncbi:phosphocholine cytidylyltransferase family protein [bacterium]|nr:phosphocholine cytidylyltransferase family protein [bacterium]